MVGRAIPCLQSSGQEIVSPPLTNRESIGGRPAMDLGEEDVVRKPENARGLREPQTARALLEVNKQLVTKKQEAKELARKKSREFIDNLLFGDQRAIEADKAKDASRKLANQELSRYYKNKIVEREQEKANSYRLKVEAGAGAPFFPYTEGEHINKTRKAQNALMREEMRGFLKEQRDTKPGRAGRQLQGDSKYGKMYQENGLVFDEEVPSSAGSRALVSPSSARQPKFLTRPTAHMSRRIQDEHVRKALEEKVQSTKDEMERLMHQRKVQAEAWEEGMMVNDALRYDATESRFSERHKNAVVLRAQIEERKAREKRDREERRVTCGYFGPEEKERPGNDAYLRVTSDLVKQMEVNQTRRLDSRNRRLIQERRMVDNSLAEISQDRLLEREKVALHKEVLVTTWDSQRKIREVLNRIEMEA